VEHVTCTVDSPSAFHIVHSFGQSFLASDDTGPIDVPYHGNGIGAPSTVQTHSAEMVSVGRVENHSSSNVFIIFIIFLIFIVFLVFIFRVFG
tara:strand:- start:297 stop:572 length:276 start_codon:yes stop_codon:yes gene_type:complete